jgi:hypothetical protein
VVVDLRMSLESMGGGHEFHAHENENHFQAAVIPMGNFIHLKWKLSLHSISPTQACIFSYNHIRLFMYCICKWHCLGGLAFEEAGIEGTRRCNHVCTE